MMAGLDILSFRLNYNVGGNSFFHAINPTLFSVGRSISPSFCEPDFFIAPVIVVRSSVSPISVIIGLF